MNLLNYIKLTSIQIDIFEYLTTNFAPFKSFTIEPVINFESTINRISQIYSFICGPTIEPSNIEESDTNEEDINDFTESSQQQ